MCEECEKVHALNLHLAQTLLTLDHPGFNMMGMVFTATIAAQQNIREGGLSPDLAWDGLIAEVRRLVVANPDAGAIRDVAHAKDALESALDLISAALTERDERRVDAAIDLVMNALTQPSVPGPHLN